MWRAAEYVTVVADRTTKGRTKFLQALHHHLLACFDRDYVVASFADSVWRLPALTFASPDVFGWASSSLSEAYDARADAFLVISRDGRYGIHREEDRMDTELFIDLRCTM